LAVHFCARDAGISIRKFSSDARQHAESVVQYYEKYQPDAVWVSADTWVTAEAMGATVCAPGAEEPYAGRSEGFVHSARELDAIPDPDPSSQGRQPVLLEALRRVKQALGDQVFVVGCFDQSPFSLACAVGGIAEIMVRTIEDPEYVNALLARCADYAIAYGQAMARCGADMLSTGDSPAGLIGPALYGSFGLPAEQQVFQALRKTTDCKLSLHICGDATELLPHMARSGADVIEFDSLVCFREACRLVPEEIALWGNIDPVGILLQSGAREVEKEAGVLLQEVSACSRQRFVLSSGCTLAPETPEENLRALIKSVRV